MGRGGEGREKGERRGGEGKGGERRACLGSKKFMLWPCEPYIFIKLSLSLC